MERVITILLLMTAHTVLWAQSTVSGVILEENRQPVVGANVFLVNTLDGTSTDVNGKFVFRTQETGTRQLVVSAIGYQAYQQDINLEEKSIILTITLIEEAKTLNEVVISAGSMEANTDREVAILKPMDIYTNAGASGDIVGAIQTLPGTQRVAEQTGLFVRGGDASESLVIIDGMTVQNAFFSNVPGVAQRSRFTPFQFKGMAFSSGGYGVRYGQALSSILELNTLDLPEKSTMSANLNMAGLALSGSKRWEKQAGEVTAYYNNLTPFYNIANTNFNFYDVPAGGGGSAKWSMQNRHGGILKTLIRHDYYQSGTEIPDPYHVGENVRFGLENRNTYFNTSFRQLCNKLLFSVSASGSNNQDNTRWGEFPIVNKDWRAQGRAEISYFASNVAQLTFGSELQRYQYKQDYDSVAYAFSETLIAAYLEAELKAGNSFAIKPGIRAEHSEVLGKWNVAPRIAMALKTGESSQVSLAGGYFYQSPDNRYMLAGYRTQFQQAIHAIANYQWINDSRSFRIEGYYKSYQHLVRELNAMYNPNPYRFVTGTVNNSGNGYASGLDLFWRDQKSISNFDYWVSYSYVNTKRMYSNFIAKATPDFVSSHNLNINTKYLVETLQLNIGATYTFASGRPYYNPHDVQFLAGRSEAYHNLALNFSYLTTIGKWFTVVYAGMDNALNRKNILGYRYSADGQQRYAVLPPMYRSVFVGVNISLTAFKKDEL